MNNKVFLIILNWNGAQMTLDCLSSLLKVKKDGFGLEIVVVDNGSTDNSVEKLKAFSSPIDIHLIENKKNLGFAQGNNIGIRYALKNKADFVCLLNNDTRVEPNFLTELLRAAEKDEKIGIVGGKIYFEKGYEFHQAWYEKKDLGKVIWYAGGKIDWKNVFGSHRGVDEVDKDRYDSQGETDFVTGCLMLIKKKVLEKIGLIDNKYFLYNEDSDFCQRAKKAGFRLVYAPKAVVWHLNAGSSSSGSELQDYFLTRNRLLFGFRWAPLRSKIALVKESLNHLLKGRKWQKIGVRDFYLRRFGKGSWGKD